MRAAFIAVSLLLSGFAGAQPLDQQKLSELTMKMARETCATSQINGVAAGGSVGPVLRRLMAEGNINISNTEINGPIDYIDEQIRSGQSFDVRRCMSTLVPTLYEMLQGRTAINPPSGGSTTPINPPLPRRTEDFCEHISPGFRMECNTDFAGFVVDRKEPPFYGADSIERCASFCRARTDCVAFNYNLRAKNNCFLYKQVKETRFHEGIVSGFKPAR